MSARQKRTLSSPGSRRARKVATDEDFHRVMGVLNSAARGYHQVDPLVEQLRQCPDAFKAGEMVAKMFDAIKYGRRTRLRQEQCVPPAGAVIPPLI
jgi:hypothetical protein